VQGMCWPYDSMVMESAQASNEYGNDQGAASAACHSSAYFDGGCESTDGRTCIYIGRGHDPLVWNGVYSRDIFHANLTVI